MTQRSEQELELLAQRTVKKEALARLRKERNLLTEQIKRTRREIEVITQKLGNPNGASGIQGKYRDTLAVSTAELQVVIQRWAEQFGEGAMVTLARRTGINSRMLRGMKNDPDYTKFTMYALAEKIMYAIGREEAFATGEIRIVPNPYMKPNALSPHYEEE